MSDYSGWVDAARSHDKHSPRVVRQPGRAFTLGVIVVPMTIYSIGALGTNFGVAVSLVVLGAGALTVGLLYAILRWGAE